MKRMSFVSPLFFPTQKRFFFQPRWFSSARPALERFCRQLPTVLPVEPSALKQTRCIARQHFVISNFELFKFLCKTYGLPPEHVHITSKFYSQSPEVSKLFEKAGFQVFHDKKPSYPGEYAQIRFKTVDEFWKRALEGDSSDQCLIIDEGGLLAETIPGQLIATDQKVGIVEQTNGGLLSPAGRHCLFPRVNVAQSAAKTLIEPILIADTVRETMERWHQSDFQPQKSDIIGVIGLGAIGRTICDTWLNKGYRVLWYDRDVVETKHHPMLFRVSSVGDLVQNSRVIFGCTGEDCLKDKEDLLRRMPNDKLFISCSSEDREFYTVLTLAAEQGFAMKNPMGTVTFLNERGKKLELSNGGFPANFSRRKVSVPSNLIALTRMLMLGGTIQAFQISRSLSCHSVNSPQLVQLDPFIQRLAVRCWQPGAEALAKLPPGLLEKFEDVEWIREHSGGEVNDAHRKPPSLVKDKKASLFQEDSLDADTTTPKSTVCVDAAHAQVTSPKC